MIGERKGAWLVYHWVGGGTRRNPRNSHQKSPSFFHKRKKILHIERKRTTSILGLGAEVYEEWLFGPFRPVVRTSSFHVEDTGSIPVRDTTFGRFQLVLIAYALFLARLLFFFARVIFFSLPLYFRISKFA